MYKSIWSENVRSLLEKRGLTIAQAAEILGTSRQYLSAILAESEPQSVKESIVENLNWLLHTDPGILYGLDSMDKDSAAAQREYREISFPDLSPVETAIMAEQSFRGGHYRRAHSTAEALLGLSREELVPAAVAQAELLSGKSACLFGDANQALPRLRSALSFYRKRLSAQPDKFFSLCIDSYRYLGLAFYLLGDYRRASRQLVAACRVSQQYPHLAADIASRLEEVVANLLRAAARQGRRSQLAEVAEVASAMAEKCGLLALTHYVTLELLLAQYPARIVAAGLMPTAVVNRDNIMALFRRSSAGFESLQGYTFILILYLAGDSEGLKGVEYELNSDTHWRQGGAAALAAMFGGLLDGVAPATMSPGSVVSEPGIFAALQTAANAASLKGPATLRLRSYLWQDALWALLEEKEFALYIMVLYWSLRDTGPDELSHVTEIHRRLLKLTCDKWEN